MNGTKKLITLLATIFSLLTFNCYAQNGGLVNFTSGEHVMMGNEICLEGLQPCNQGAGTQDPIKLSLPNGLQLTFGEVLAMPDYFTNPGNYDQQNNGKKLSIPFWLTAIPISDGKTEDDQMQRFRNAFATLASNDPVLRKHSLRVVPKLLKAFQCQIKVIKDAIRKGQEPSKALAKLLITTEAKNAVNTEGASLAESRTNWDHFGLFAQFAYIAGHTVALQDALDAGKITSNTAQQRLMLMQAYAEEAFADHFLTDRFASGHIRTPRKKLHFLKWPCNPKKLPCLYSLVGDLLAGAMHNEDGYYGLHVSTTAGNTREWTAYGDMRYMDTVDQENRNIIRTALKASAEEVYKAFNGNVTPLLQYAALQYIPHAALFVNSDPEPRNFTPLIWWQQGKLYRRTNYLDRSSTGLVPIKYPVKMLLTLVLKGRYFPSSSETQALMAALKQAPNNQYNSAAKKIGIKAPTPHYHHKPSHFSFSHWFSKIKI